MQNEKKDTNNNTRHQQNSKLLNKERLKTAIKCTKPSDCQNACWNIAHCNQFFFSLSRFVSDRKARQSLKRSQVMARTFKFHTPKLLMNLMIRGRRFVFTAFFSLLLFCCCHISHFMHFNYNSHQNFAMHKNLHSFLKIVSIISSIVNNCDVACSQKAYVLLL